MSKQPEEEELAKLDPAERRKLVRAFARMLREEERRKERLDKLRGYQKS